MLLLTAAAVATIALAANDEPGAFAAKIPAPPKNAAAAKARCKDGSDKEIDPLKKELEATFQKMNQELSTSAASGRGRMDVKLVQEVTDVTLSTNSAMQGPLQAIQTARDELNQKLSEVDNKRRAAIDACPIVQGESSGPEPACEKAANDAAKKQQIATIDSFLATQGKNFAAVSDAAKKGIASMQATQAKAAKAGDTMHVNSLRSSSWMLVSEVLGASLNPCTAAAESYPSDQ